MRAEKFTVSYFIPAFLAATLVVGGFFLVGQADAQPGGMSPTELIDARSEQLAQIDVAIGDIESAKAQLASAGGQDAQLEALLSQHNAALDQMIASLRVLQQQLESMLMSLKSELDTLLTELEVKEQELRAAAAAQKAAIEAQIASIQAEIEEKNADMEALRAEKYDMACDLLRTKSQAVSTAVNSGYGSPMDVVHPQNGQLLKILCDSADADATLEVGTGASSQYVYERGYMWRDGNWKPMTLHGTEEQTGVWFLGKAYGDISIESDEFGKPLYAVAYVCTYTSGQWKCGCKDSACQQPSWQLQVLQFQKGDFEPLGVNGAHNDDVAN